MSIEEKIDELIAALDANTKAQCAVEVSGVESETKPAPASKPSGKKKGKKKKGGKKKTAVSRQDVREVLSQLVDKESAIAVLEEFGVTKLSDLAEADFEAAIAEANEYEMQDDMTS